MKKQIPHTEYRFEKYTHLDRWMSYHIQLKKIFSMSPTNLLEVGVGDGFIRSYLENHSDIEYTSADLAEDLHPDVVASVTELPFQNGSFDLVIAFQILEHLPFKEFDRALSELARVSKGNVLISLPHFGPRLQFFCKIPFLPEVKIAFKIPYPKKHTFDGQHYWEIGKHGYGTKLIRNAMQKHFVITREFISFWNQYHRFYFLEKRV